MTDGDIPGAAHERIRDPWLMRGDCAGRADVNSLGMVCMGQQSLGTMLQLMEMRVVTLAHGLTSSPDPEGKDR